MTKKQFCFHHPSQIYMNMWILSFSEDNRCTMAFLSRVSKCARGKTTETKSQKCHEHNSKSGLVCKTIYSFALNWLIIP